MLPSIQSPAARKSSRPDQKNALFASRKWLLVGTSIAALLGAIAKVDARSLGGGGGGDSSPSSSAAAVAAAAAAASAQRSSAAGQQAIESMARAARVLQGLRDTQGAARAAALAAQGAVANGLTAGGLVVAPGAGSTAGVWAGAQLPSQTQAGGRTQVEIKQTEQKAILNWSSFNVGRETDVYFNQTAGGADKANWIALNRVTDPSLAPSRILGTIKAEGQVYVVNKNGIVFGGAPPKRVLSGLQRYVHEMTGWLLHPKDAWTVFQLLPDLTQQRFIRQVYMQELREGGRDQNRRDADGRPANGGYNRGYAAIAHLFPGDQWKGNVQSDNMLLRTGFGGDIRVMTPGGGLQVAALNQNVGAGNGLVTLGYGKIDIFARQDVIVNRSRVLTFAGGDLTIWSTLGGIDAGRGAKTTRVPSAPLIATDDDGVTRVKENADISGSGIGTIVGFAGVEPGDVDLIAPEGTVDAGDAGIRVSGNFNVAAMFVLNTDNIKVGGETKGVPKTDTTTVSLAVETKDKAAADAVKDASQQQTEQRPSVIIVEVLGYGGGDAGSNPDEKDDDRKKRRDERQGMGQDPNNPALVVGYGKLTEAQKRLLSEKEREKL